MERMNLDYEEFQYVVHLCRRLPAGLDLKHFLTRHLTHRLPTLARKIGKLELEEVNMLRTEIDAHDRAYKMRLPLTDDSAPPFIDSTRMAREMANGLPPDNPLSDGGNNIPLAFPVPNDRI